jgi:phosphate transport system protein
MTRERHRHQLHILRTEVLAMAMLTEQALDRAMRALGERDVRLAEQVLSGDRMINAQRWATEAFAVHIIATQAPMAKDLRLVAAALHIVTELERIGDHAAGIAKIARHLAAQPPFRSPDAISRMAHLAHSMLTEAMTAYLEEDAGAARTLVAQDDAVDQLYEQLAGDLLTVMQADPTTIDPATHLLWVAHNLERIADRVTNICERIVFAATGQLEELAVSTY